VHEDRKSKKVYLPTLAKSISIFGPWILGI
jgi:hypothetical protein